MSRTKVSIIGGAGYGAAELLRHLVARDDVELLRVSSKDFIGDRVDRVHRHLSGFCDLVLEDISPVEAAKGADFVFLAMPHKITAKVAMEILDEDVRIIDLSGDFRLRSLVDYERDYAPGHPCPDRLGSFVYGLPELNREAIVGAKHVASPGCFATCITLGLLPLAKAGLLVDTNVRTVAMTGSSGSGVRPSAGTHHPVRHNNLKPYKVLHHQHRSEILQTLGDAGAKKTSLDFIPVSAPLSRGILAVSQLDLHPDLDADKVQALFEKAYADHPMVRVMAPHQLPEVAAVAGTAHVEVSVEVRVDEETGKRTLATMSVLDNLIKGGAGQAIQSFNLMCGRHETTGFEKPGLWP